MPRSAFASFLALALCDSSCPAGALENGMALTPPMGFKTWNAFHGDIDEALVCKQIDAITSKARLVDGVSTSLVDLGYARVGIDDNWQACKTGWQGTFHAEDGTPLVNHSRFPSIKDIVSYGHSKGALMEWYTINCICLDTYIIQRNADKDWAARVYAKEAEFILDADFDGVKIDNCGDDQGIGFNLIWKHLNESGKDFVIEDSNQGHDHGPPRGLPVDPHGWCPGNFFRVGGDIVPDYGVILAELQHTIPYQNLTDPISRPGCWAHPDMLEVANFEGPDNVTKSRTHFGAWCIVSAPLYLSFDLTNEVKLDLIWDVISNKEAIAINQAWYGHPGRLVVDDTHYQVWAKKLSNGSQAALLLNKGASTVENVAIPLRVLGAELDDGVRVRDVWLRHDLPHLPAGADWNIAELAPFSSEFVVFEPQRTFEVVV